MVIVTEDILKKMAEVVAQEVHPEAIVLFGSHATGHPREDSDVDLLVIESDPFGPNRDRRREMTRLWYALMDFPFAKDILLYSRDEVQRWRNSRNHIIAQALREGRTLYGKP